MRDHTFDRPIERASFASLYPFRSHFTDVDGLKYHYLDEGQGDPVVMVHGNPTWSFFFRHLVRGLSDRYRTLAPDHIGCGLSSKPDARSYRFRLSQRVADFSNWVQALGLKRRITLLVHDWGGMIAMAYAVENPERIARIIVLNTAAFLPPAAKPIPLRLRIVRDLAPFSYPAVLGFNLFARAALYMAPHTRLSAAAKAGYLAPYNCPRHRLATLEFVRDIPLSPADQSYALVAAVQDRLARLNHIPMLILWGRRDFVFDVDYYREWQRRFPNAESHLFADAGHYILDDIPQKAEAHIRRFLKNHPI